MYQKEIKLHPGLLADLINKTDMHPTCMDYKQLLDILSEITGRRVDDELRNGKGDMTYKDWANLLSGLIGVAIALDLEKMGFVRA